MSTEADSAHEHGLRRELRFWEAIALSIGIMAPGAADLLFALIDERLDLLQGGAASIGLEPGVQML